MLQNPSLLVCSLVLPYFVFSQDFQNANIFIARFSRFMRSSLYYSQAVSIPLKKEIELTGQYIDPGKLRFGDQIDFRVEVHPNTNLTIQVPPLMLQPLIENAIKHGVLPSEEEHQTIQVSFSSTTTRTTIQAKDNGIGFNDEPKYNNGMRITTDHIRLLHPQNIICIKNSVRPTAVEINLFHEN